MAQSQRNAAPNLIIPSNFRRNVHGRMIHPHAHIQWNRVNQCDDADTEFVNESHSESYKCGICMDIMENPVSIGCGGGHLFCKSCICQSIRRLVRLRQPHRCPSCRDPTSVVREDVFTKRMIGNLMVKCPNYQMTQKRNTLNRERILLNRLRNERSSRPRCASRPSSNAQASRSRSRSRSRERNQNENKEEIVIEQDSQSQTEAMPMCEWQGEYRNLSQHLSVCPFTIIPCELCHFPILRNEKETHHPNCPWLAVQCNVCDVYHVQCEQHFCPLEIMNCPYCHGQARRKDYRLHLGNDCPRFPIECQYGCEAKIPRESMPGHYEEKQAEHLSMVKEKMQNGREEYEALDSKCDDLENDHGTLKQEHDQLKSRVNLMWRWMQATMNDQT